MWAAESVYTEYTLPAFHVHTGCTGAPRGADMPNHQPYIERRGNTDEGDSSAVTNLSPFRHYDGDPRTRVGFWQAVRNLLPRRRG